MIIKNPGGFTKDDNIIDLKKFPPEVLNKATDVLIIYRLADNTRIFQRIPIGSLKFVSEYSLEKLKNLDAISVSVFIEADHIATTIEKFYKDIGIEVLSHCIRFVEGNCNDIQ